MPNTKSAEKRMRQERKRTVQNRAQRTRLKTLIKKVNQATEPDAALAAYRETAEVLDRLASRRLIHPNKAARKKSRLTHQIAKLGARV